MNSSNDRTTDLRNGAIARASDAAELALALKLIGELREGTPIELGDLAELLGPRAPGRKCAGGPGQRGATNAPASQGHLDAILRALPLLERDRIIVFHSPLTLDPAGHAVGGTRDRMPAWEFEPTLETAGRPPRSEQAIRFAEQVERAALGYTITADASRLAVAADASGRITGAIGELAKITARSKDATLRTLEELAQRGLIAMTRTGKRPIILHVALGAADADPSIETAPEPVSAAESEATMLPEPAEVAPAADVAPVETCTTPEVSPDPVAVIEIAPTRVLFPHLFKDYRDRVEEFFAERMTADAVAALRRDAVEIERACFEQEEWVRKVLDAAYVGLAERMGRLATLRESQMDYIAGIIRNNSFDLQFKKLAAGRDASEFRAEQEANRAEAQARQLLRRCAALNNDGEEEAARAILTAELEPLAPKLVPLFDNDPTYAGAMLRLAFKQGADWIVDLEPDEFALDFDPSWRWPAELPTVRQRRGEQAA